MKIVADLHCHSAYRNYQKYVVNYDDGFKPNEHIWNILESNPKHIKKGNRAMQYSQADLKKCVDGGVKFVFAAIMPFEPGFLPDSFVLKKNGEVVSGNNFLNEVKKLLIKILNKVERNFDEDQTDNKARVESFSAADINMELLKMVTKLDEERIVKIKSNDFDNWQEFERELEFYENKSGVTELDADGLTQRRYFILSNQSSPQTKNINEIELTNIPENETYVVLTVEGSQLLSMKNPNMSLTASERIEKINQLKTLSKPVFFITFAHHFANKLCSHAQSLPQLKFRFFGNSFEIESNDQSQDMNKLDDEPTRGINDRGIETILELLNLEVVGDLIQKKVTPIGNRILIDLKHMSALARKNFYDLVEPFNIANPTEKIPFIASHIGYSGIRFLDEQIQNYELEESQRNDFRDSTTKLLKWNINFCDEDIFRICQSEGLIGINFDQRVLGEEFLVIEDFAFPDLFRNNETLFTNNLLRILIGLKNSAIDSSFFHFGRIDNPSNIWNVLCIGTDFDGFIDPIDKFSTALAFENFREAIKLKMVKGNSGFQDFGVDTTNIEQVLDKIFILNTFQFLTKHFNRNILT